ncbi:MAG: hypothetical protein ACE363_01545 [Alphaproteobacteria bacterium]
MMKALLICLMMMAGTAVAQDAPVYVAGVSGVPLMPGLTELEDETVVFDKPGGRIVDAVATGAMPTDQVLTYYSEALDVYGWIDAVPEIADGLIVMREGEVLHLRIREAEGGVRVHYSLAPYRAKP